METYNFNISVVGLGVIGGSLAYSLKKLNFNNVWGIDVNHETLMEAKRKNMIDDGFSEPEYPLSNSDVVILAIYPRNTITFISEYMNFFKPGAIIMDTSGVKSGILSEVQPILRKDIDFIGGHPMAGNEGKGVQSATEILFKNANFLITPSPINKEENIQKVEALLKAMGFGKISRISPQKHDEIIGYTSQMPHLIAASLINSSQEKDVLRFTGNSFGEFTRIARMNAPLWGQLIMENRQHLLPLIDSFMEEMSKIRDTLSSQDMDHLESIFSTCTKKKEEMK